MLIVYAHCVATFLLLVFVDFFALLPLSFFSFPGSSGFASFLSAFILDYGLVIFSFLWAIMVSGCEGRPFWSKTSPWHMRFDSILVLLPLLSAGYVLL